MRTIDRESSQRRTPCNRNVGAQRSQDVNVIIRDQCPKQFLLHHITLGSHTRALGRGWAGCPRRPRFWPLRAARARPRPPYEERDASPHGDQGDGAGVEPKGYSCDREQWSRA